MNSQKRLTRRTVLKRGAAASAAVAVPYFVPSGVLAAPGRLGANDRIILGFIGVGGRARQLMDHVPPDGARIVAICDCYLQRCKETLEQKKANWRVYQYYQEMLEKEKLDAVVVATTDHARVLPCIRACEAGLDVYAEKPLTLTIREGRVLVNAVRKYKRILQVGSQQRSMEMNRFACEFIRKGGLGKLVRVQGVAYTGPRDYQGLPEQPIPEGNDWDVWQAQTEWRPFNHALQFGWMGWRDYSGGEMTNWGAHGVDQIQWALGKCHTGPTEIWPTTPGPHGNVSMKYADGIQVDFDLKQGPLGGGVFTGTEAKMVLDRNVFTTDPPGFIKNPPDPSVAEPWEGPDWVSRPHIQNWLDCIRTRSLPTADVEIGHRSITVCHLANIARRLGRHLRWDPDKEQFIGDDEANTYLDRPRRKGWELPAL
ncbi:MAG TPA: Gfo/Idh/MocA family oxidoreductase [Phycisphaerae bacterium]|nr:Gfo/Idh/MocA family oxidoreductase [Phycisphaerae bacterium]HOJ73121.1 Gfo/Idh/MocA family oxidoreductase [Phycisphaerae bacterium]HOM52226.1 Gfo/Idh/MocA family oxidoreductase [Phycisphaerae bacterium]HON65322.1 Gfo/Idh/MocA family oxidoreductase [Phycisphaerae bacterium]HOQ85203.1 Gfo/Idh/MocA family oxidoreductase [Phycisphaerae bacterium]